MCGKDALAMLCHDDPTLGCQPPSSDLQLLLQPLSQVKQAGLSSANAGGGHEQTLAASASPLKLAWDFREQKLLSVLHQRMKTLSF